MRNGFIIAWAGRRDTPKGAHACGGPSLLVVEKEERQGRIFGGSKCIKNDYLIFYTPIITVYPTLQETPNNLWGDFEKHICIWTDLLILLSTCMYRPSRPV